MRFEDVLLGLVARKPITGYDAKKWLDTEGLFLRANADRSQIYRTLHRLAHDGKVTYTVESRDEAPDAKVYEVTPLGAQHLLDLARSPYLPPPRWQEPDFLARYGLLGVVDPTSLAPLIQTELDYRRAQVVQYRDRDRTPHIEATSMAIDPITAQEISNDTHEFGAAAVDHWLAWLDSKLAKWSVSERVKVVERQAGEHRNV